MRRLGYAPQLDGLRAVAIALVMMFHLDGGRIAKGGWLGINVFFVLSGFLITALLVNEHEAHGRVDLRRFLLRRIFRLTPALLGLLLGAGIWMHLNHIRVWPQIAPTVEYRRNFVDMAHQGLPNYGVGLTWSLATEDQFYLVWPLLLIVMIRVLSRRAMIGGTIALAALSLATTMILFAHHVPYQRMYFGPDSCANMLLIGCAAGIAYTAGWFAKVPAAVWRAASWVGLGVFVVALVTVDRTVRALYIGPTTLLAIVAAVVILGVLLEPNSALVKLLSLAPVVWVGKLSYSLYLWHYLAFLIAPVHGIPHVVVGLVLAFAFACASYYLIERPGLALKARFEINRTPESAAGTHRRTAVTNSA